MRRLESVLLLLAFLFVVLGVGAFISINTSAGNWYVGLVKPPFHPPNWVFSPIWFSLYVTIAVAGWRVLLAEPDGLTITLWSCQMILNWFWAPLWFGLHAMWPAFVLILAILISVIAFIWKAWKVDRVAAALFVPYAAWVMFSSVLNFSIALLN